MKRMAAGWHGGRIDARSGAYAAAGNTSPSVQILIDAGAIPFTKTNVPVTLLLPESFNPVWARGDALPLMVLAL